MPTDSIVIVGFARTPIGQFQGQCASLQAPALGAAAIQAALERSTIKGAEVDEVLMGCVLPAGLGQAPARQASLGGGVSPSANCTTVNKMCGSAMKAILLGHDVLVAHSQNVVIAGGMESMSNSPYILPKARAGYRMGHQTVYDHMFFDGLEDAYEKGTLMGVFADRTAKKYGFTRSIQDEFALTSLDRAKQATAEGWFQSEIVPLRIPNKNQTVEMIHDEGPAVAKPEKIPQLKPAFDPNGTVTAANSSSISDGAAAVVMMREQDAKQRGLPILAKIVAHASQAQEPAWFTTAPVGAIQKVLKKANWTTDQVDLYEINEAFAVVTLAAIHDLKLDPKRVNIQGGACVLGHPIGASGARIVCTLIAALQRCNQKRGVAALCIGGGEATALAIERP